MVSIVILNYVLSILYYNICLKIMKYYLIVGIILATVALIGCTRTTPTDTTPIVTNTGTISS